MSFKVKEVAEAEVYLVRLPDGRVVARTKDELLKMKKEQK